MSEFAARISGKPAFNLQIITFFVDSSQIVRPYFAQFEHGTFSGAFWEENMSIFNSFARIVGAATAASVIAITAASADEITLRGASLFDEEHAYTKTLRQLE